VKAAVPFGGEGMRNVTSFECRWDVEEGIHNKGTCHKRGVIREVEKEDLFKDGDKQYNVLHLGSGRRVKGGPRGREGAGVRLRGGQGSGEKRESLTCT